MDCYCRAHTGRALSFHFMQISLAFCFYATCRPPGGNASGVGSCPRSWKMNCSYWARTQPAGETASRKEAFVVSDPKLHRQELRT